ncbi:MAG: 16S rRNA (uracil(1498)-N(3))-methyltransferase [Bdellovibrionaceae bacterium]|nr:16S rRNA (uracil(1498)-N(3))-methyltransferase [Pseudobdellovibrionaceae bacterium]MBC7457011.1 16S rRNA (uracil(1498)-N(3))-methyltransferase [Pseudobdellovibrionaceae bacterium]
MRRYWIEKSQIYNEQVVFKSEQYHHIFDVCRQTVGNHFEVITEDSNAYLVEVLSVDKKQATAKIIETRVIQQLKKPHIHIALSVSRFPVMDSIVERAVELGVSSIVPFYSEYSFIRKAQNMPAGKLERWNKIVISATQQCGRGELMKIQDPIDWTTLQSKINPSTKKWCLFAYEGAGQLPLKNYVQTKKQQNTDGVDEIWIIVGSEGGFSEAEVESMKNLGLDPVTLGTQVLRVETACLTLVSALKYEFELLG